MGNLRLAVFLIPAVALAQEGTARLTGAIVDTAGAYIAHAAVELDSGTRKYQAQTDDAGVYRFSNLTAGEYTLRFAPEGFEWLTVKPIGLSEREVKEIPEITLPQDLSCEFRPRRDFIRLLPVAPFGELSGSVLPSAAGVEVVLICRTFRVCRSTKTDPNGRFSFDMLSAGAYGLSFHRDGFYDQDATGYEYYVNAGMESVYVPLRLEQCADGNCSGKKQRIQPRCE